MPKESQNAPFLTHSDYYRLTWPQSIEEWYVAWKAAMDNRNFLGINELLHFGLRLAETTRGSEGHIALIRRYLFVADGHRHARNFGSDTHELETPFGRLTKPQVMHRLAIKAWQELCIRVFTKHQYEEEYRYFPLMLKPELAAGILDFIDPAIAYTGGFYSFSRANVDYSPEKPEEFNDKALKFARYYLRKIFDHSRGSIDYSGHFFYKDDPDKEALEAGQRAYESSRAWFFELRPRIIVMMNYYGILDHLRGVVLDVASLDQIERLARSMYMDGEKSVSNQPLEEIAFKIRDDYHEPIYLLSNRVAVDICLHHPQVIAAHEAWQAEQARIEEQKKHVEINRAEAELQAANKRLQAMRTS